MNSKIELSKLELGILAIVFFILGIVFSNHKEIITSIRETSAFKYVAEKFPFVDKLLN